MVLMKVETVIRSEQLRLALYFCGGALQIPPDISPFSGLIPGNDDGRCCDYREGSQLVTELPARRGQGEIGDSSML